MTTKRLFLRPFQERDTDFLFKLNNDKEVNKFRSSSVRSKGDCLADIKGWIQTYQDHLLNVFVVESLITKKPLGLMIFVDIDGKSAELGYRFLKEEWKKGYCFEASKKLIDTYFSKFPSNHIVAETAYENVSSCNLLLKLGFKKNLNDGKHGGALFKLGFE